MISLHLFKVFFQAASELLTFDQWFLVIFSALLSAALLYIPGLKEWYDGKSTTIKRAIMAGGLLVIAALTFWLGCTGFLATLAGLFDIELPPLTCDLAGGLVLVKAFIIAIGANQAAYWLLPNKKKKLSK